MSDSVKSLIIARVIELIEGLKIDNTVKVIERRRDLLSNVDVRPAILIIFGDETVLEGEEDYQGYELMMPLAIKTCLEDARDLYSAGDRIEQKVQTLIESDPQLSGLCNRIVYGGAVNYSNEINKPEGGSIIAYDIFWRRRRGAPDQNY